jgi:sigma-E factor negative regulatory protein RseB
LINENGKMIERMLFTSLLMQEPAPGDLIATTDATGFDRIEHPRMASAQDQGPLNWQVTELPSGFKLLSHEKHQFSKQEPVEHMLYSDGVASVSVFIANQNKDEPSGPFKGSHLGGVSVYKAIHGDKQITVMGEVPEATVQMIGHNLSLSESHD